jgi:methylthioribose-1-phosphate isomerase
VHVWVDETRPRSQGASLTAWELLNEGVPHTIIPDNTGGHLMQHGMVDMVITGADRITGNGDAANKIGTYLKALAAADNGIPFYIAAPSSSFDWTLTDGVTQIPIEQRQPDEVRYVSGLCNGKIESVLICPADSPVANYGFDVTPARLITGIVTERGVCKATTNSIRSLFPEKF